MKAEIDQFQNPHSRTTRDTYTSIPYGGAGDGVSSSPLIPSLDPRGPRLPGRCLRLTDTHRMIDGEPDPTWDWDCSSHQASTSVETPSEAFSLDPASRAHGSLSPDLTNAWRDAGVTSTPSQVTE